MGGGIQGGGGQWEEKRTSVILSTILIQTITDSFHMPIPFSKNLRITSFNPDNTFYGVVTNSSLFYGTEH